MEQYNDQMRERGESEILFSRTVKAGKRVYYIDVKRDRHNENYLSITESKRIKDGTEEERPTFEKHKIFLYREDMDRFVSALTSAVDFTREHSPEVRPRYYNPYGPTEEGQGRDRADYGDGAAYGPRDEYAGYGASRSYGPRGGDYGRYPRREGYYGRRRDDYASPHRPYGTSGEAAAAADQPHTPSSPSPTADQVPAADFGLDIEF